MNDPLLTRRQIAEAIGTTDTNVRLRLAKAGVEPEPGTRPLAYRHSTILAEWQDPCRAWLGERLAEAAPVAPPPPGVRSPKDQAVIAAKVWIDGDCLAARLIGERQDACFHRYAADFNAGRIAAPDHVRDAVKSLSRKSLMAIRHAMRDGNVNALLDRRGRAERTGYMQTHPEIREYVKAHLYHRRQATAPQVMRALEADFPNAELPSERTLQREITRLKEKNAWQLSAVHDPDGHRSRYAPAGGDAAAGIVRPNQRWEIDSSPADVLCTDGRWVRIAVIDVFTRRVMVLFARSSNSRDVARLLRRAILAWGVPEAVRTDGGSDYVSKAIVLALSQLPCRHEICPPYTPERKGFVERVFRTLGGMIDEIVPGFAGHNVAERAALRSAMSMADRRGKDEGEVAGVALSGAELQAIYDAFIEHVYHKTHRHSGLGGRTPAEMARLAPGREWTWGEQALAILFAEPVPDTGNGIGWRVVQKKGLSVDGRWFDCPAFGGDLAGRRVQAKYNDDDAARLWVFDDEGGFVAEAIDYSVVDGVSRQALAADKKAHHNESKKQARTYQRDLEKEWEVGDSYRRIVEHAAAQDNNIVPLPIKGRPHESEAGAAAARAADATQASTGGPRPVAVTEEERALAAQARAAREARLAEAGATVVSREEANAILQARARRAYGEPGRQPVLRGDGAPVHDDVAFALWVEENPGSADDTDRALVEDYAKSSAFRGRLERERRRRAELAAATST